MTDVTAAGDATATVDAAAGLQLFSRFAYPPNQRGYCGPDDHRRLLAYLRGAEVDEQLRALARAFDGPLPYLTALAEAAATDDPFRHDVVEAYWVGGDLVDRVDDEVLAANLAMTFRDHPGGAWPRVEAALPGGLAHHSFQVLVTYPWIGLLPTGRPEPLRILDQCRVRWGQVQAVSADGRAAVRSRPLAYDGAGLSLAEPRQEEALQPIDGLVTERGLRRGDWVALHWEWICCRLDDARLDALERHTNSQLRLVNERVLGAHRPTTGAVHRT